jgi:hypothetical protein
MPSRRAMRAATGATCRFACRLMRCQVSGFRNLCTERPAVYLAAPLVGRMWLGPEVLSPNATVVSSEEKRAVSCQMIKPPVEIPGVHLEMFRRVMVGEFDEVRSRFAQRDLAVVAPCCVSSLPGRLWKSLEQQRHSHHNAIGERP